MLRCEWKHRRYLCFLTLVKKKNTVNYSVFGHLTLKNHGICSGCCFSPRKNTVNNSNFPVFSCFSLFFMPLLGEPDDAVRAVAVAKRCEYKGPFSYPFPAIVSACVQMGTQNKYSRSNARPGFRGRYWITLSYLPLRLWYCGLLAKNWIKLE